MIECSRCGKPMDEPNHSKIAFTNPPRSPEELSEILNDPKYKTVMTFCPDCGKEARRLLENGDLDLCEIHRLLVNSKRSIEEGGNICE